MPMHTIDWQDMTSLLFLPIMAESNGSLLPGLWRDSLHVTCGLTACTPGSAPGPMLGNEYGKTLPFISVLRWNRCQVNR